VRYGSGSIQYCNGSAWTSLISGTGTLTGTGTANYGAVWSGATSLVTDSALYIDTTNHRHTVGMTAPTAALQVSGTFTVSLSTQTTTPSLYVASNGWNGFGTSSPTNYVNIQSPVNDSSLRITPITITQRADIRLDNGGGYMLIGRENSSGGSLAAGDTAYYGVMNVNGAYGLQFGTNNTTRVTIDPSGNVGIGTTGPSYPLTISNSSSAFAITNGTNTLYEGSDATGPWIGSANSSPLRLIASGTEYARLTAAGNMGIGMSAPTSVLQVSGTFTVSLSTQTTTPTLFANSSGNVGLGTSAPSMHLSVYGTAATDGLISAQNSAAASPMLLGQNSSGNGLLNNQNNADIVLATNNAEKMRILSGGNVGIANTAPIAKLDITGTVSASDIVQVGSTTTIACASSVQGALRYTNISDTLQICTGSGWKSLVSGTAGAGTVTGSGAANYVAYWSSSSGLTYDNSQLYYDSTNHRLGIGNTSPIAKLDVTGTISASDAIQVSGSNLTCSSAIKGAMRYSNTSSTIEYCNSTAWTSLGPSATSVPAFSVNKNGTNQTVSANAHVKLTWSNEVFDTNNNFASDKFTPTIAGKYLFVLALNCTSSSGYCLSEIYKNGTRVVANGSGAGGSDAVPVASIILDMNGSTDYVEGYVYTGGTTINGLTDLTNFTGTLIAPYGQGGGGGSLSGSGAAGQVTYWNGASSVAGSNNHYWDNINGRLSIGGNTAPTSVLQVSGTFTVSGTVTGVTPSLYVSSGGNVGIGTTSPSYPLDIQQTATQTFTNYGYLASNGTTGSWGGANSKGYSLRTSGAVNFGEVDVTSDHRRKQDIEDITADVADAFIAKARPVQYRWKSAPKSKQTFGFIAQDIGKAGFDNLLGLTPNDKLAATVDADGYVSPKGFQFNLNYEAIIPLLTKAMQSIKASMVLEHARTEDEVAKLKAANDNLATQLKAANDNHLHDAEAIEQLREAVMKIKRAR
jgi:Chaperone of endosialidase